MSSSAPPSKPGERISRVVTFCMEEGEGRIDKSLEGDLTGGGLISTLKL